MADEAKMSMMLCSGLESAEQDKVERLDGPISSMFIRAGVTDRIICQSRGVGDQRTLDFTTPSVVVGSVRAVDFLGASDEDAVTSIALPGS